MRRRPKTKEEAVTELAEFLACRTRLATIDPSAAGSIALRLYDAGWRKVIEPPPPLGKDRKG